MSNTTEIFDAITLLQRYEVDKRKIKIGSSRDGACILTVADVLELSYVKIGTAKITENQTLYPTHLDMPNHSEFPDHVLSFYPFVPESVQIGNRLRAVCQINDLRYRVDNR